MQTNLPSNIMPIINNDSVDWLNTLLYAAQNAFYKAYAPYSGYKVGAALITINGNLYIGSNVENASYSCCMCAEQAAVANMVSNGETFINAIMVVADYLDNDIPCTPCGKCRQIVNEFAISSNYDVAEYNRCTMVYLANLNGITAQFKLNDLLPWSFNSQQLK